MKKPLGLLLCALALCQSMNYQEDDLVFDDVGEDTPAVSDSPGDRRSSSTSSATKESRKSQRVEKLLGLPDAVATVGHVFKLHIPKQAFAGSIDYYEARGSNGKGLAHWLHWDEPAAVISGVPSRKDVGRHRVVVKAYGKSGDTAQDSFLIHVVPEKLEHFKHKDGKKRCTQDQDRTMLTILIDAKYENLKPSAKVNALENLAGFLGMHTNSISIQPELNKEMIGLRGGRSGIISGGSSVVLSGPGNVGHRREKHSTLVQWQVGCDGHFWPQQLDTVKQIPEQARDGTLTEVLQLPVYKWLVRSDSTDYSRNRRDAAAGSGDDYLRPDDDEDDEYDDDYDEEDYDSNEGITDSPQEPKRKPPIIHPAGGIVDEHRPHRHHHGEDNIAGINNLNNEEDEIIWRNAEINNSIFNSTTTTTTSPTTIAVTLPSSTTTTTSTTTPSTTTSITTSTTTTTTTTTTEMPTSPSTTSTELPSTESSTSTTSTTTSEQPPSSPSAESTSTTTEITSSGSIDTLTTENTTTTTNNYTNLTSGSNIPTANITMESQLEEDGDDDDDGDLPMTTERDIDNETEPELTTILQSNNASDSSGNILESAATSSSTAEPNVTGPVIYSVNATTEEFTEPSAPTKEISSTTSFSVSWSDNATEKVPGEPLDPYDSINVPVYNATPSSTTSTSTTTTTTTTPEPTTQSTTTTTTEEPTTPSTTTMSTTTTTTTTTTLATTPTTTTTTEPSTTTSTTTTTTEKPEVYGVPNTPPRVERRLKKIPITQGKLLSYKIPEDTFNDLEDGDTRSLRLRVYEKDAPLKSSNWLQFNEDTQEVYGLPLEEHYGTYPYEVIALDSQGLTASDRLDIVVQQHKQIRAFNHEFHIYLKIEKRSEFPTNVDWQLKVMRNLAELFGDNDLSYITVRSIDIDHDQAIYTWTNDSLARSNTCPQEEIDRLYRVLVVDEKSEEPSAELTRVLGPEIRPKRVVYQGLEQCHQTKETKNDNERWPMVRNQIDQLDATVGQLFVFKVPKDTFFDEDDGDTRSLKVSLFTPDGNVVTGDDWLQFDTNNQEFYGVPLTKDIGRKTYQLIAKDREGLEAIDSLVAVVNPPQPDRHGQEVSMQLHVNDVAHTKFANSALLKRQFIERLQKLYGDRTADSISLVSIKGYGTDILVNWRNVSLPTSRCPTEENDYISSVLVDQQKGIKENVQTFFNHEVVGVQIWPKNLCSTGSPPSDIGSGHGESPSVGSKDEEYLITYVLPAIIIAAMFMLAGIIACILYKRRRSGKMSVSEKDDERQSFRSKGIPVIFQDELDEKPDPGNKSPIILKEEKPPLPPPEYQRAEDGADIPMLSKENSEEPYQPPPPFATNRDNNRQNRPKPTPTYRKPPPYVPP